MIWGMIRWVVLSSAPSALRNASRPVRALTAGATRARALADPVLVVKPEQEAKAPAAKVVSVRVRAVREAAPPVLAVKVAPVRVVAVVPGVRAVGAPAEPEDRAAAAAVPVLGVRAAGARAAEPEGRAVAVRAVAWTREGTSA